MNVPYNTKGDVVSYSKRRTCGVVVVFFISKVNGGQHRQQHDHNVLKQFKSNLH